jgi:BlaI family penicillinase repressor
MFLLKETLTYAEWMVMSVLWGNDPMPLSGVIKKMGEKMNWSYRTYATYLNKLCEKGVVGFEALGRDKFYYAIVPKDQCIKAESKSIINKVGKKGAKQLLVCLVKESGLSKEDYEELNDLLNKLSQGEAND